MGRDRSRWSSKSLRKLFPLRGERLARARLDGRYGALDQPHVRFMAGGEVEFDGERGRWRVEGGALMSSGRVVVYLLCSPEGRLSERLQFELGFQPDGLSSV